MFHQYQSLFMRSQPLAWMGRFDEVSTVADELMSEVARCKSPSLLGFAHLARAYSLLSDPAAACVEYRAALEIGRNGPHYSLLMLTWPDVIRIKASESSAAATAAELREFLTWYLDQGLSQPMHLIVPLRIAAVLAARAHRYEAAVQLNANPFSRALPGENISAADGLAAAEEALGDRLEAVTANAMSMGLDDLVHLALDVCSQMLVSSASRTD